MAASIGRSLYTRSNSYRYWQAQLGRSDFSYGQFGENFTVDGLPDGEVCIGDRYRIGSAVFEVTQPRVTCYRVGIRMNEPQMAALLVSHGRPGFYFRVIEEGEVEAGDEIVQVTAGPERMTVAEANALLYTPGHSRSQLERAVRIPALSAGWGSSFQALLDRERSGSAVTGNPGLTPAAGPPPAWTGFRPLRVSRKERESAGVTSLVLEPTDGRPLGVALPGQFIVLRLTPAPDAPALLRSYSLSSEPRGDCYRVSIKRETHGAAGAYVETEVRIGDVLDASAPRGSFTLRPGDGPVVLLSAGVGATPVLAMLHALAAGASSREVWWIYGARHGGEHPFAAETRALLKALPRGHSHIRYSSPNPGDRLGVDFDATGRLNMHAVEEVGAPRDADFYLCGPSGFMNDLGAELGTWGVAANRIHTEIFGSNSAEDTGHRGGASPATAPAGRVCRRGTIGVLCTQRTKCALGPGLREPPRTCRGMRCARAVGMPDRGLPHLRDWAHQRRGRLPARAGGAAGRGQCADLLLPTSGRHRHRSLNYSRAYAG